MLSLRLIPSASFPVEHSAIQFLGHLPAICVAESVYALISLAAGSPARLCHYRSPLSASLRARGACWVLLVELTASLWSPYAWLSPVRGPSSPPRSSPEPLSAPSLPSFRVTGAPAVQSSVFVFQFEARLFDVRFACSCQPSCLFYPSFDHVIVLFADFHIAVLPTAFVLQGATQSAPVLNFVKCLFHFHAYSITHQDPFCALFRLHLFILRILLFLKPIAVG